MSLWNPWNPSFPPSLKKSRVHSMNSTNSQVLIKFFLMSNSFSAHPEKTDFSETRNLSYLLRWCLCFRCSDVYFLWVRKRRISRIFRRHEFLKCKTCRNDWLLIEFIKITKSASVICWDEWFNSGVLDAHFYECGKRRFLWFSGDQKI